MRINWHERIETNDIILRPYRRAFVSTYHSWMLDPWLRETTASDEMTMVEEYAAQRGWRDDEGKLTFIFFNAKTMVMAGDVNLFLLDAVSADSEYWGGEGGGGGEEHSLPPPVTFEVMVMVGDALERRKGFAGAAVRAIARYAYERLGARRLVAKIGASNTNSRALFARLGFKQIKIVPAFDEVHYITDIGDNSALRIEGKWEILADEPDDGEEAGET